MTPFRALWRVDLRRGLNQAKTGIMLVPFLILLLVVIGEERANAAHILMGWAVIYVVAYPVITLRDRLDGTLDLLAHLPVPGEVIARSRLAAVASLCLLGGLQIAAATTLLLPPGLSPLRYWGVVLAAGIGGWGILTGTSIIFTALLTRYHVQHAANRFMITLASAVIAVPVLLDLIAPELQPWRVVLEAPLPLLIAVTALMVTAAVVGGVHVMARGIDEFEPTPEGLLM